MKTCLCIRTEKVRHTLEITDQNKTKQNKTKQNKTKQTPQKTEIVKTKYLATFGSRLSLIIDFYCHISLKKKKHSNEVGNYTLFVWSYMHSLIGVRDQFRWGGGGGAEVSWPNMLSSVCPKIKSFCPNFKGIVCPKMAILTNSRGLQSPSPPRFVRLCIPYSLNKKEWICSLFKEWILEKSEIIVNLEWTFVLFTHFGVTTGITQGFRVIPEVTPNWVNNTNVHSKLTPNSL